jgi:transcriptional regulator of stress and heat shock response
MHTVNAIGDAVDLNTAAALLSNLLASGAISERGAHMALAAVGNAALRPVDPQQRDTVRASILKQILIHT